MNGKVHITVCEGRNLIKCEPYCVISFDPSAKEAKTEVHNTTQNPTWQKKFSFELPTVYTNVMVKVLVMDENKLTKDVVLGRINIPLSNLKDKEEIAQWYSIVNKEDPKNGKGEIFLRLMVDTKDSQPEVEQLDLSKANKQQMADALEDLQGRLLEANSENSELVEKINSLFADMYYTYCNPRKLGVLEVQVISGRELPAKDLMGDKDNFFKSTSDPYCKLACGGKLVSTTAKKSTVNPDWNETFSLPVMHAGEELVIDIFDKDLIGKDEFMGQVRVLVGDIIRLSPPSIEQTYPLKPKKYMSASKIKKVKGTLKIALKYTAEKQDTQEEVVPTKLKRKEDLLIMAEKVRDNLLERIALSNDERSLKKHANC